MFVTIRTHIPTPVEWFKYQIYHIASKHKLSNWMANGRMKEECETCGHVFKENVMYT